MNYFYRYLYPKLFYKLSWAWVYGKNCSTNYLGHGYRYRNHSWPMKNKRACKILWNYIVSALKSETGELAKYCGLLFQRWILFVDNKESLQNIVAVCFDVEIRIRRPRNSTPQKQESDCVKAPKFKMLSLWEQSPTLPRAEGPDGPDRPDGPDDPVHTEDWTRVCELTELSCANSHRADLAWKCMISDKRTSVKTPDNTATTSRPDFYGSK